MNKYSAIVRKGIALDSTVDAGNHYDSFVSIMKKSEGKKLVFMKKENTTGWYYAYIGRGRYNFHKSWLKYIKKIKTGDKNG